MVVLGRVLLLATALLAVGCGGTQETAAQRRAKAAIARYKADTKPIEGFTRAQVSDTFSKLVGQRVKPSPGQSPEASFETLDFPDDESAAGRARRDRYGYFTVYLIRAQLGRRVLLQDRATKRPIAPDESGIYWSRSGSGWTATKLYGQNLALVYDSDAHRLDEKFTRIDRVMSAVGKPVDQVSLPPAETPCARQGIAPEKGGGKAGTCKLGEKTVHVVDAGQPIELGGRRITKVLVKPGSVIHTAYGTVKRAKGAYVAVFVELTDTGRGAIDNFSSDTRLVVDGRTYDETGEDTLLGNDPYPIQPGAKALVPIVFDVPVPAAKAALARGALAFPGSDDSLEYATEIGRIRLSTARRPPSRRQRGGAAGPTA